MLPRVVGLWEFNKDIFRTSLNNIIIFETILILRINAQFIRHESNPRNTIITGKTVELFIAPTSPNISCIAKTENSDAASN